MALLVSYQDELLPQNPTKKDPKLLSVVFLPNKVKNFTIDKLPSYMKLSSPLPSQQESQSANLPRNPPVKPLSNVSNIRQKFFCTLCRKNGEPVEVYSSHSVKSTDGKVTCPILRNYTCGLCGATGEDAHTRTHCPIYLDVENMVQEKPKFRIMSNGKPTLAIQHK